MVVLSFQKPKVKQNVSSISMATSTYTQKIVNLSIVLWIKHVEFNSTYFIEEGMLTIEILLMIEESPIRFGKRLSILFIDFFHAGKININMSAISNCFKKTWLALFRSQSDLKTWTFDPSMIKRIQTKLYLVLNRFFVLLHILLDRIIERWILYRFYRLFLCGLKFFLQLLLKEEFLSFLSLIFMRAK
jgi:hypothetical protein